MALHQEKIIIKTDGRSTINITQLISDTLAKTNNLQGACNLFLQHTSGAKMPTPPLEKI